MSGGWQSSTRRAELPPDWDTRRAAVARRAGGRCENTGDDGQRCPNPGTDCDHKGDRSNHSLDALQWLCSPCHTNKTQVEAAAGAAAVRAKLTRPLPTHPGLH